MTALVERFNADGAVWPLPCVSGDEARALTALVERLSKGRGRLSPLLSAKPHLLIPGLWDIVHSKEVVDPVTAILGPDVLCFGTSFIWKPPLADLHVSWHQDATHWGLEAPVALTVWLALTPSHRANGGVKIVPGSHGARIDHDHPEDPANMLGRKEVARTTISIDQEAYIELAPGDISIHDVLLLHASAPNRSDDHRIGFAMRYIPSWNRQRAGTEATATWIAGRDHGHYGLEREPSGLMKRADMLRHGHILRCGRNVIYRS
ncbi:MAG: phytanoyl-CoA dioxygenase family protein [Oceanicaulis sp.]